MSTGSYLFSLYDYTRSLSSMSKRPWDTLMDLDEVPETISKKPRVGGPPLEVIEALEAISNGPVETIMDYYKVARPTKQASPGTSMDLLYQLAVQLPDVFFVEIFGRTDHHCPLIPVHTLSSLNRTWFYFFEDFGDQLWNNPILRRQVLSTYTPLLANLYERAQRVGLQAFQSKPVICNFILTTVSLERSKDHDDQPDRATILTKVNFDHHYRPFSMTLSSICAKHLATIQVNPVQLAERWQAVLPDTNPPSQRLVHLPSSIEMPWLIRAWNRRCISTSDCPTLDSPFDVVDRVTVVT